MDESADVHVRQWMAGQHFLCPYASIMSMQRRMRICAMALLWVTAAAGQDAAQEVQEGNVKQWMEYYERERRQTGEAKVGNEAASKSDRPARGSEAHADGVKAPEAPVAGADD